MKEQFKKMLPFVMCSMVTLGVNMFIQASGVSESCQSEIRSYCARVIAAFFPAEVAK